MNPLSRIVFHSKEDMSVSHHLSNAEKILDKYHSNTDFSINDLLEIYNVKLYFENDLYLLSWSEGTKIKYKEICQTNWGILKEKILQIDDDVIEKTIKDLEYNYKKHFWNLLNQLNSYKKISPLKFDYILNNFEHQITYILQQKGIVEKFDKQITNFLIVYKKTTEILLSKLEEKKTFKETTKYYFPKSLTLLNKENIISNYLSNEDANLNYVRLIENSKDSNELKLSPKTRLKAKKKSRELNNQILENGVSWNIGVQISFCQDQIEPVKFEDKERLSVTYSEKFINSLNNDISLFYVYKKLFIFTDETNLINLISKNSEVDSLERIFMTSKNAYETGEVFTRKHLLSSLQILIFEDYLKRKNNSTENLISSFVKHLNNYIEPSKFIFKIQNSEISYIEKIRNIAPEYEFLLKQYQTYVDEGEIDIELIQISSTPIRFSEIYSQSDKKYIYIEDKIILQLKYQFFSEQSMLHYIEPYDDKYNNLYDLLNNENVKIENFQKYQIDEINYLLNEGYLKINSNEYIKINAEVLIYIIGELHRNDVLSYWNYDKTIRNEIDKLIERKMVKVENTLLTIAEKNYFNYYLNKKEFTNGLDLRNKYLHGTNSFSEIEHKNDYYTLLRIIILTLLKIEDDILIKRKIK